MLNINIKDWGRIWTEYYRGSKVFIIKLLFSYYLVNNVSILKKRVVRMSLWPEVHLTDV